MAKVIKRALHAALTGHGLEHVVHRHVIALGWLIASPL
jgi:hypothetical protein